MTPIVHGMEKRSPRGVQGFTIIELVVVVAIIAVVVSIVSPRMQVSTARRVEGMANQMVAHLEMARSNALGKRLVTKIVFDVTGGTYTAYVDHDRDASVTQIAAEVAAFPEFGDRDLEDFIEFGRGNASTVPGDGSMLAVTLTDAELDLSVQGVPEPWGTMGTVYLVHQEDDNAVAAISVASSGSFKAWRWSSAEQEWQ